MNTITQFTEPVVIALVFIVCFAWLYKIIVTDNLLGMYFRLNDRMRYFWIKYYGVDLIKDSSCKLIENLIDLRNHTQKAMTVHQNTLDSENKDLQDSSAEWVAMEKFLLTSDKQLNELLELLKNLEVQIDEDYQRELNSWNKDARRFMDQNSENIKTITESIHKSVQE